MSANKPIFSLKNSIVIAIMVVSSIAICLSLFFSSYYETQHQKSEAARFIKKMAAMVEQNAAPKIKNEDNAQMKQFLVSLANINEIVNVHVYSYNPYNQKLEFFSSFNQPGSAALRPQLSRVKQLTSAEISGNFIEYTKMIQSEDKNTKLGYVYIRMQMNHYNIATTEHIQLNLLIGLLAAIAIYFAAVLVQRKILIPIDQIVGDIQDISYNKNYRDKVKPNQFVELERLGKSVNIMLKNFSNQMDKFARTEKEVTDLNRSLEEKVINRTQALRDSNQELLDALEQVHQYQSQMIESEKMASLGQMVAGVAHEVNTPIGLGVTVSTMLTDKIQTILGDLDKKSLTAKKLKTFLEESQENNQLIYRNLTRAAELINSFKQVAVDQAIDDIRTFNVKELMSDILLTIQPRLNQHPQKVLIHCDENLQVRSKAGPINQIIINLVMNSLLHGFKDRDEGEINITIWLQGDRCHIRYQDDGNGIEEKIKQKIFDPFVTTIRGKGGSGLGMHLVYNLVTQALHGHIEVKSELGNGAQFDIEFPAELST